MITKCLIKSFVLIILLFSQFISALNILNSENIEFVDFRFTTILGKQKVVTVPINHVENAFKKGLAFDGSSIEGCGRISESDMLIIPDLSTLLLMPYKNNQAKTASVICGMYKDYNTPFDGDPRNILIKALDQAHEMGYEVYFGPELEFFIGVLDSKTGKLLPFDNNNYFSADDKLSTGEFKNNLVKYLQAQNINVEKFHHEVAGSQYEMSLKYSNALQMADSLVRAQQAIKLFCQEHGLHATFMPKISDKENGSGMHVHFSLFDIKNNKNIFYDNNNSYKLSVIAKQFISGILNRIENIMLLLNPGVNSYKRLVPGYEAPTNICWGAKNRSALIRIPLIEAGDINASRAEIRCPDGTSNPYLLFAALIKSGLAGIKNAGQENIFAPVEDNLYSLSVIELKNRGIKFVPQSLRESIDLFEAGDIGCEIFDNSQVFKEFIKLKNLEYNKFSRFVTDWELENYL